MTQKTKQIIIAVIIIIIAFVAFKYIFGTNTVGMGNEALVADQTNAQSFVDGQAVLALLNRLKEVDLDKAIFSTEVFNSLESFARDLEPQVSGRNNPFAPIGVENSAAVFLISTSTARTR